MRIASELVCRSRNMVFERLLVTDLAPTSTVAPCVESLADKEGGWLPFRLVSLSREVDAVSVVAVYPELENLGDVGICLGEYDKDEKLVGSSWHAVNFGRIKWASRKNYRLHANECAEIRNIDERVRPYGDASLTITTVIPNGDQLIVRGEATWLDGSVSGQEVICLNSDLSIMADSYTLMSESSSHNQLDPSRVEHSVSFSMSIDRPDSDLFFVSWNPSKPSRAATCRLTAEERDRLCGPFNFYLYEDASRSPFYQGWLDAQRPSAYELDTQRAACQTQPGPCFHVFTGAESDNPSLLEQTLESLRGQTYPRWRIIVAHQADACPLASDDERLTHLHLNGNPPMKALEPLLSQEGLEGDYLLVLRPGDTLEPHALFHFWQAASATQAPAIYCDTDSRGPSGDFFHPIFKPEYNVELLRCEDYLTQGLLVRLPFRPTTDLLEFESLPEQLYDLALNISEMTRDFARVPRVLIHQYRDDVCPSDPLVLSSFKDVLRAHLSRIGSGARVEERAGHTRVVYPMPESTPLISIIIPNKDQVSLLKNCVDSILEKTTYPNYEVIIVENNSTESETFAYYDHIRKRGEGRVSVVFWKHEFNFSKIVNFGREHAKGSYLVLLNNDTQLITPDWLERLLGLASREKVGAVGVKLYYPDDTIQHAGVSVSFGVGHQFVNLPKGQPSYLACADVDREVSCVTAACLMSSAEAFDRVGGFDQNIAVAYNDVNYCLALRAKGYRILYTPSVELYHFESISRGRDVQGEKQVRSAREWSRVIVSWAEQVMRSDPFSSDNVRFGSPDCCYYLVKEYPTRSDL